MTGILIKTARLVVIEFGEYQPGPLDWFVVITVAFIFGVWILAMEYL